MYYIEQNDDEIVKYKVEITGLYELLIEIVTECGKITHKSYDSTVGPNITDTIHIRNYQETKKGKTQTNDELTNPPEDLYHFEYDEYEDPKLVKIARKLLNGDTSSIVELRNPILEQEKDLRREDLQTRINKILEEDITKINISELDNLKKQLENYQESEKMNHNRKSDLEYYQQVLECINLTEVSRIKVSELEEYNTLAIKMESFFSNTGLSQINQNINNELYKRLIKN